MSSFRVIILRSAIVAQVKLKRFVHASSVVLPHLQNRGVVNLLIDRIRQKVKRIPLQTNMT
ncbi:hypothetical protein CHS52_22300 [Salmonella enterica subsp. enterica serovar Gatuni]|nr:hypothetical protein [Salmonella enterica]ECA7252922.1 hypothetical protein [Salmonella enterica subsp. enterica serovar Oranienburg]ECU9209334.1 hypothetical protein [Salmonella enterica subsp. enterica serovar Gatuni]EBL1620003.1 hypothetical protein [Salmonella enterica]EBN4440989.1 hypothetical protein [Salmonella enterica]